MSVLKIDFQIETKKSKEIEESKQKLQDEDDGNNFSLGNKIDNNHNQS